MRCTSVLPVMLAVNKRCHVVVETHPESLVDLRLDAPFPALSDYVKSFDFAALNSHDHGHVPAVVIIIHFLERFKSEVREVNTRHGELQI